MRLWVCLLLTCASVWGFPERRSAEKQPDLPQLAQQLQGKKDNRVREAPRDCKGKCASSIAQKAAAEAKAAQAAQNAAGAQAAHMVSNLYLIDCMVVDQQNSKLKTAYSPSQC